MVLHRVHKLHRGFPIAAPLFVTDTFSHVAESAYAVYAAYAVLEGINLPKSLICAGFAVLNQF